MIRKAVLLGALTLGAFQTPVIESMARAKLKVGYDFGKTMVYATGGAVRADTDKVTESGTFLGLDLRALARR